MPQAIGILTKVLPKATGYFSLKIGDEWYGGGKTAPNAAEGDMVEVTYNSKDVKGKLYHNSVAIKVVNKTAAVAASAKAAVAQGAGGDKDAFWRKKEDRDIVNDHKRELGATRNTAVEIVNFAIEKGFLPAMDKVKAAEKFDLYLSMIEGTATRLIKGGDTAKPVMKQEQDEDTNEDVD